LFSAPSRASVNIRPIALRGFDIVSPVFCNSRLASSERVWAGVDNERSWADSSPACGERLELMIGRTLASAKGVDGDCGSEGGSAWMASSTFLHKKLVWS
jgi:hypothetical protein